MIVPLCSGAGDRAIILCILHRWDIATTHRKKIQSSKVAEILCSVSKVQAAIGATGSGFKQAAQHQGTLGHKQSVISLPLMIFSTFVSNLSNVTRVAQT